ncbi:hypothetical protein [Reyranella sp.]|uniref:GMP synthase (glutamine-hydrolyzing) n=1 Tax=Reyranella sp. TaxID=1929291 RepID=UPI003C79F873
MACRLGSERHACRLLPVRSRFPGLVANRLIDEVQGVNRVTYDIASEPPGALK